MRMAWFLMRNVIKAFLLISEDVEFLAALYQGFQKF
jgi:hypothetical protein